MSDSFTSAALGPLGQFELKLKGRIYADIAPQLKDELMQHTEQGLKHLIVDASALEQIDSSGLNVFVHLLKKIRPQGGKIVFYGLNANLKRVFDITKLGTVMTIVTDRDAAMGAI